MPNESERGRKRGRRREGEPRPKQGRIPPSFLRRSKRRGRKRKKDPKQPADIPKQPKMVDSSTGTTPAPVPSTSTDYEYEFSSILPYLTDAARSDENMFSRDYVKPTASLSECLFAEDNISDDIDIEVTEHEWVDIRCSENVTSDFWSLITGISFEESIDNCIKPALEGEEEASSENEEMSQVEDNKEKAPEGTLTAGEGTSSADQGTSRAVPKGIYLKSEKDVMKLRAESKAIRPISPCILMTESEEVDLMRDLERKINRGEELSIEDIRLYRKLKLKHMRTEKNPPDFDPHVNYQSFWAMIETNTRISLDRYRYDRYPTTQYDYLNLVRTRISRAREHQLCSVSPYTKRILEPFIMQDYETTPLWLKLMDELKAKTNINNPTWEPPPRASIDYCHVMPHHLPAMNSLAELYFWPGINLKECLRCPDFTCVVFYKKLLVGFTIAFPNFFRSDIYIAFMVVRKEWQNSGIGTVMLYHLIESFKGRDLTLHVSPTNPAVILYQKFGFKVVCFEKNFYSNYLTPDSKQCRHAYFMRSQDNRKK